ncbi:MAG: MopE-related protein, partial [Myxococcota bacterium]|nr:MopE-related protein [Myxococcota bacterium]
VELSSNPGGQVCYLQVEGMGNAQCVSSMGIGSYVLTFSVTDSDGNTATASTTFNVVSPLDYDFDGDGYSTNGGDCNDSNATIYPGAPEICDGLDNDCNDLTGIDVAGECYDDDGDGYCESPPCVNTDSTLPDCDDTQVTISPDAVEIVNGIDDDCDGLIDEGTSSYDDDGDGYCESPPCVNTTNIEMDCDDDNYLIHPNAQEVCNDGIDNNCNTLLNEENAIGCTNYYYDEDGDSYGVSGPTACYCEGGSYPYTGINANDCYDYNADVYPGQTDYFDFDRGDSSYDYNCNNTEEYAVNTLTAGCEWGFFGGFQCNLDAAGWQDTSVPDCGYAGLYVDDCDYSLPGWCLALCGLSGAVSGDLQDSINCVIQYCNASCNSVQYNMVQSCR